MLHWEHTHAISTPGFTYRALTSSGPPSQTVQLPNATHAPPRQKREHTRPTTPHTQPLPRLTRTRFHHHPLSLATTHGISSPTGTEMFHFPASPLAPYTTSDTSDTPQRVPGLPIRTPSDHSPSAGSPRLIAGHHVLHRPLMPRHPPNAQKNKQQRHTNKTRNTLSQKSYSKMLASTIQFTTNPPTPTPHHPHKAAEHGPGNQGALPQNPDSMPPPHTPSTRGHPPPPNRQQRACLLCQHQTNQPPRTPVHDGRPPSPSARSSPGRPRPIQRPRQPTTRKPPHTINP